MAYLTEFGVLSPEHPLRKLAKLTIKRAPRNTLDEIMAAVHIARDAFVAKNPSKARTFHHGTVSQIEALEQTFTGDYELMGLLAEAKVIHEREAGGPKRATRGRAAGPHTPGRPDRPRRARGPVDSTAKDLQGLSLEEMYEYASPILGKSIDELKNKYGHLNPGLVRMNLGNRIRGIQSMVG